MHWTDIVTIAGFIALGIVLVFKLIKSIVDRFSGED